MIRIITLSNKPDYLPDAIASVLAQTRKDLIHVIGLDSARYDWGKRYAPAVFYNRETRNAHAEDYILWLSDDDLLQPRCVELLAGFLDIHSGIDCVYGRMEGINYRPGHQPSHRTYYPTSETLPIYDMHTLPLCKIDGGQLMVRRSVFERIKYPWMPEDHAHAPACDGYLLNNIARVTPIHPLDTDTIIAIHRFTPQSAHVSFARPVDSKHVVRKYDQG